MTDTPGQQVSASAANQDHKTSVESRDESTDRPKYCVAIIITSVIAFVFGAIALFGWWLQESSLTKLLPGSRAMQPLTAVGLILASGSVAALAIEWRRTAAVASVFLIALATTGLVQTLSGANFGTDYLLFETAVRTQESAPANPGRMSPLVSMLLILLGVGCLTINSPSDGWRRVAIILGSFGLIVSLLSLVGFILLAGDPELGVDAAVVMPLHTAVGLSALFPALLLIRPEASWIGMTLEDGWRGRISRLLLTTATVPIPIAWLADRGHQAELYGPDLRMTFIVMGAVLLLALLAIRSGVLLGREREERDEIARAVDLSPNLLLNQEGDIVYWSKGCEQLYGWTAGEALGRRCEDLLGDCGSSQLQATRTGTWEAEMRHKAKDGQILSVWATCISYLRGRDRQPTTLLFLTDVTAQLQAQAEVLERDANLLELQRELLEVSRLNSMGEMAAALAHELNQPLTAAANFLGAVEVTLSDGNEPPATAALARIRQAISRAKKETLRAGDIVRRLREFIARGDADMKRDRLSAIVKDALPLGLATADRKSISVKYELAPEADDVLVDRVQIQQVLVNLIRNAAEAMVGQITPPPALLLSSSALDEGFSEVSVSDNGPGIPAEVASELFAPFSTSKSSGLGVGLSICKRIVESHGGRLQMTPRPGRGTSFKFTIPNFAVAEVEADD